MLGISKDHIKWTIGHGKIEWTGMDEAPKVTYAAPKSFTTVSIFYSRKIRNTCLNIILYRRIISLSHLNLTGSFQVSVTRKQCLGRNREWK